MTSYLRKSIAMGIYAANNPTQNFGYVWPDWLATNTPYVRFWIDWTQLAPYPPANGAYVSPGADTRPCPGGGTVAQYVGALDAQIALARGLGLKVVLTFVYTPHWANLTGDPQFPDYKRYPPEDVTPTSPWGLYFFYCLSRWSALNPDHNGAYADFFEICNEPNYWKSLTGTPIFFYPGRMMVTAQAIQRAWGIWTPYLAAPAVADDAAAPQFTRSLCDYLRSQGFRPDVLFAWSTHNYRDIRLGNNNGGQAIRAELRRASFWTGWPDENAGNPYVLQTEGGSHLSGSSQAAAVRAAYLRCDNDAATQGQGLAMFTNYLDITAPPPFDTGLRDLAGNPKPLYSTWAGLPQP